MPHLLTSLAETSHMTLSNCKNIGMWNFFLIELQLIYNVSDIHNRQVWPCSKNEAGQSLTEFCQENALVIANTLFQQHEKTLHMDITRWSTLKSDWLYSLQPKMEKLYTASKTRPGADLAQIMNSLLPNSDWNWRK